MSDALRRTLRTGLQVALGLLAGAPLLAHTAGLPGSLPGLSVVLAASAAITRLMSLPLVEQLLPGWLKAAPAKPSLPPIGPGPAVSLVADPGDAPAPIVPLPPVSPVQPEAPAVPPTTPDGGASA